MPAERSRSGELRRDRALVIGASMAGLLAARVLSDHFRQVVLIERDRLPVDPEPRPGVPQGRHLHTLLVRGEQIMERFFPGLSAELVEAGALRLDLAESLLWFQAGGYKQRFSSGIPVLFMGRPLLEGAVRRRVLDLPNVTCMPATRVSHLVPDEAGEAIAGVQLAGDDSALADTLAADLVVDATGRHSRSPQWLTDLGYAAPPQTEVGVDIAYTTRLYKRSPELLPQTGGICITAAPPELKRSGALLPVEGDRWMVTFCGWLGDRAPAEEAGFLAYARSLADPAIYDVIRRAQPVSGFYTHHLPSSLHRHYERLARFPQGYLVLGDALCSFNPVYGQGMTVSAMEAEILDRCLGQEQGSDRPLAQTFFRAAAEAIKIPWQLATSEDLKFPAVTGQRPPGTRLINAYLEQFHRTTFSDPEATRAFYQVITLTRSPLALLSPAMVLRVLATNGLRGLNIRGLRKSPLLNPGG